MGGMVLETNMSEIMTHIEAQTKQEKSEVKGFTCLCFLAVLYTWGSPVVKRILWFRTYIITCTKLSVLLLTIALMHQPDISTG